MALKRFHDLKLWLVMSSSCDNSELVPVPGFGFIPACIRNNIETQYQVSPTLSLVNIKRVILLTGSSLIPCCLHILTLLSCYFYKLTKHPMSRSVRNSFRARQGEKIQVAIATNLTYSHTDSTLASMMQWDVSRNSLVNCGCAFCCL